MSSNTVADIEGIKLLIEKARKAQKIVEGYSQRRVDELAAAMIYTLSRPDLAKEIAELALKETKMGNVESKIKKLTLKMPAVFEQIKSVKTVGIIEKIPEEGLTKIAKPIGVIAALVPSTNPEATPLFKGTLGLRGRNAVIFSPHPKSAGCTSRVVNIMRDILQKNGAPEDLFLVLENPSVPNAKELMAQCDLTMATGSGPMVKSAYSSGKPAYGVGAGNAVIVIDETADIAKTAERIRIGKTGDNASGCSAENSILIQESIYNKMIEALKNEGAYLANQDEKAKLQKEMWGDGHLNRDIVAKPVQTIADIAGIHIPENKKFIMVEESGTGPDYPFSGEKLSLVLTVYKYKEFDDAIDLVNLIQHYSGLGHSCGIHSNNREHIERFALKTYTTKVIVRQPHGKATSFISPKAIPQMSDSQTQFHRHM